MAQTSIKPANPEEKHCENCGKALFGRTDKRFCNDTCRNTFNREKNLREQINEHKNLPEIFRIIKNNYHILKSLGEIKEADEGFWMKKGKLELQGFDERFFTSTGEYGGILYNFCFERGWSKTSNGDFMVIERAEQASI